MLRFTWTARRASHALTLTAVTGLALGSAFAAPAPRVSQSDPDPTPVSAPAALEFASLPTPPARTQGADQVQAHTTIFNPRAGLPRWLHGTNDVALYAGSEGDAALLATLPRAEAYLKPLGAFADTRVQVYFPGDDRHPASQAWVNDDAVEPSDMPAWLSPSSSATLPAPPKRTGDDPAPDTTAIHIAIVDDASGQMLYGEQPHTEVPQASTTKIATTIVALEREPNMNRRINVTISATAMAARDGSSTMGIEPGRSVSLDTLLHGMMLPSGNDAAEQVAVALADSREQYVDWMNQEAAALGLKDTHFINPSGMDADGHYSSAYDMAMLARYAMRNPTFRDLASTSRYTSDNFVMHNLNRFLDLYPGADGIKIGYTDNAAETIVASATRDGHRVYISLMHSQDLVGDSTVLFNWVWANYTWP
jgi:D-alanyl-D-alanine carboxypeptidase-like protein